MPSQPIPGRTSGCYAPPDAPRLATRPRTKRTADEPWTCAQCGETYASRPLYARRYCSPACGESARSTLAKARNQRHYLCHERHGYTTAAMATIYRSEYLAWASMRARCTRPTRRDWPNYGGRGITVCTSWLTSFAAFIEHIGPKPSPELSLDRIDNDGHYEPGNVRWATARQQTANRRISRH